MSRASRTEKFRWDALGRSSLIWLTVTTVCISTLIVSPPAHAAGNAALPRPATPRRQEVGVTQLATGENRGFLSSPGQPMVALGPLEVGGQSEASAINIDGVVVGMVPSAEGTTSQAVTWTPLPAPGGMQITDLGALLCRHLKRGRCCARRRRRLGCAGIP